jgi:hypothetical protein
MRLCVGNALVWFIPCVDSLGSFYLVASRYGIPCVRWARDISRQPTSGDETSCLELFLFVSDPHSHGQVRLTQRRRFLRMLVFIRLRRLWIERAMYAEIERLLWIEQSWRKVVGEVA